LALHGYHDVQMTRREQDRSPVLTDSGNYLLDVRMEVISDPLVLDRELNWIPGVVENGLFTGLADEVILSDPDGNITTMDTSSAPAARVTTTVRGRRLSY
ncbi:MAG: ribose-5-phosphate isomerase A, partial [Nocardioidaceae bacterium]